MILPKPDFFTLRSARYRALTSAEDLNVIVSFLVRLFISVSLHRTGMCSSARQARFQAAPRTKLSSLYAFDVKAFHG